MRRALTLVCLIIFAAFALAILASCNQADEDEDTASASYGQKQPFDRASPTEADVTGGKGGDESGEATETAGETTEESGGTTEQSDEGTESGTSASTGGASTEGQGDSKTEEGAGMTDTTGSTNGNSGGNTVVLETTKGDVVIQLYEEWSPLGVAHFKELVNDKFYDGAPWFRVIPGFVAQCGIAADPAMNQKWEEKTIKDEPVVKGNARGTVVYGKTGLPDSRSTHIFINFVDNSSKLDGQGFSAFGEVIEGMDVADKLFACEFRDQGALAASGGLDKFKTQFQNADYIVRAYIK